jgi:hypothetical protein
LCHPVDPVELLVDGLGELEGIEPGAEGDEPGDRVVGSPPPDATTRSRGVWGRS